MNAVHARAFGMTLKDLLRPKALGEQVVLHVLPDVQEPKPDFDAMKRILTEAPPVPAPRKAPKDDDISG